MTASTKQELQQMKDNAKKEKMKALVKTIIYFAITLTLLFLLVKKLNFGGSVLGYLFSDEGEGIVKLYALISVFVVMIIYGRYNSMISKYEKNFKELIVGDLLTEHFENYKYEPEKGITKAELFKIGIKDAAAKYAYSFNYYSEDLISATSQNVKFRQSDVRITHKSGRSTVTDMDGRVFTCKNNKKVEHTVIVNRKGGFSFLVPDMPKVEMEDVVFDKKYNVYATDSHDAFYVLTPHIMSYLKNLEDVDEEVMFVFYENKLYVLRNGRGGILEVKNVHKNIEHDIEMANQEMLEIKRIIMTLHMGN